MRKISFCMFHFGLQTIIAVPENVSQVVDFFHFVAGMDKLTRPLPTTAIFGNWGIRDPFFFPLSELAFEETACENPLQCFGENSN